VTLCGILQFQPKRQNQHRLKVTTNDLIGHVE
jgi:hypothetical protein